MTNFIGLYDNALSDEECSLLVSEFDKSDIVEGGFNRNGNRVIDPSVKKCRQLNLYFSDEDMFSKIIYPALARCMKKYTEDKPSLNHVSYWRFVDDYSFQKYEDETDGYKVWHTEHGAGRNASRIIAWMFYLNDAKCGTEFIHYPTIPGKKGLCAIWPAGWEYVHRGVIPNIGLKYIVTGWVSFTEDQSGL